MALRSAALLGILLSGAACSSVPRPPPALVQNREVEAFAEAAAWPNAEPLVAIVAAQEFIAARHERDGYEYFQRLAREQPRRPILLSLEGLLQARAAGEIPLLRRVAWVEEAIGKLDRGAQADPVAGRLLRGLVFAELPDRFGKARQAVADLEASLESRESFPADLDRGIYRGLAQAFRTLGDEARSREMLRRAGTDSLEAPAVAGNLSVGPEQGFRFTNPRLAREADGVYVAEGFDFGNIAFLVDPAGAVAIDAGTTEESARAAMKALRRVTDLPVRYVILTTPTGTTSAAWPRSASRARSSSRERTSPGSFRACEARSGPSAGSSAVSRSASTCTWIGWSPRTNPSCTAAWRSG